MLPVRRRGVAPGAGGQLRRVACVRGGDGAGDEPSGRPRPLLNGGVLAPLGARSGQPGTARSPVAGATTAGAATAEVGADATVAEAVLAAEVAVDAEAPPDAWMGLTTQVETAAEMVARTTAMEEAEEAMEVVDTVVGAEAPARAAGERGATVTPRVEDTTRAPTEPAPAAPRRTAERMTFGRGGHTRRSGAAEKGGHGYLSRGGHGG